MRLLPIMMLMLTGCFAMAPSMGASMGPSAASPAPMTPMAPMTNDQALAYAQAHRANDLGLVTATNRLGAPICRLVFLSSDHRSPFVNQAGATDPQRGNLDPTRHPLLGPGQESLVTFAKVGSAASGHDTMTVTAFGCFRNNKSVGMSSTKTPCCSRRPSASPTRASSRSRADGAARDIVERFRPPR